MRENNKAFIAAGLGFSLCVIGLIGASYLASIFRMQGWMSILLNEMLILAIALIIAFSFKLNFKEIFSIRIPKIKEVLLSALTALTMLPVSLMLAALVLIIVELVFGGIAIPQELVSQDRLLVTLFFFCVLPAVCEEALFRGLIQGGMNTKFSPMFVVIVCGILFGFFHMDVQRFIGQALLGIAICYVVYRTRSIFCGMVMHFLNNGIAMGAQYISQSANSINVVDGTDTVSISILNELREQAVHTGLSFNTMLIGVIITYWVIAAIFIVISILVLNALKKQTRQYHEDAVEESVMSETGEVLVSKKRNSLDKTALFFVPGLIIIAIVYITGMMMLKNMF